MRRVYGLGDALQKTALAIDDALWPTGAPGRKQHACSLVDVQCARSPGSRNILDVGADASTDILLSDDPCRPRIFQHFIQPFAWIMGIQSDKRAPCRQAS